MCSKLPPNSQVLVVLEHIEEDDSVLLTTVMSGDLASGNIYLVTVTPNGQPPGAPLSKTVTFIIDSGTNYHMLPHKPDFVNLKELKEPAKFQTANKSMSVGSTHMLAASTCRSLMDQTGSQSQSIFEMYSMPLV